MRRKRTGGVRVGLPRGAFPWLGRSMTDLLSSIERRRSVRAFSPRQVPRDVLLDVFALAQRAPSWCNIQPWRVWVASGETRAALVAALSQAAAHDAPHPDVPFPSDYPEPYATHRRACGKALYDAMGVERHDAEARQAAWMRNFVAFDAPHVAIVAIDRRFDLHAAIDVGCWLQTVLLLATSKGLATCAQASLSLFPSVHRRVLGIPEGLKILFGVGLGYEEVGAAANACRTTRQPLDENVQFV